MQRPSGPDKTLLKQLDKGYEPSQVELLALRFLHQHFDFSSLLTEFNEEGVRLTLIQFLKSGQNCVHYSPAVIDAKKPQEAPGHPSLEVWLDFINRQIEAQKINVGELIVAPLLQVQLGRRHFNTLVIYYETKNRFRVYIIEPRDNNLTKKLLSYPIEGLQQLFIAKLKGQVEFLNIKIGHQSLIDDTSCGKHHLNYLEVVASLPIELIQKPKDLKNILKRASLIRRFWDDEKLTQLWRDLRIAERIGSGEMTTNDIIANGEDQGTLKEKNHSRIDVVTLWNRVLASWEKFSDEYAKRQSTLFDRHTRQFSVRFLTNFIRRLTEQGLGEDWRRETYYKLLEVLFAFYVASPQSQSDMRVKLEESLGILFEVDVSALLKTYSHANLEKYFFDRLLILRMGFVIHSDKLKSIYELTRFINDLDTGIKLTDGGEKAVDLKRVLHFEQLKIQLNMLIVEMPQKRLHN